ncbi:hypothetical protein ASPWEDRAFT_25143 [Aspergillus wentii DTO 134E9]|uniref:Uncharacterized protein n=1 Tax=Aspergillus wentii DTO 134E9 TaxID=1073089 RepID=A0A1L9RWI3_ASPWE|nr:uncharacterized protein ASPWEDRAFT_25143 [Aspergillus wentii DTO 134E9]KAI9929010.1 hypothetical protein MW887_001405 [Aspergillus wentii]OJJ39301.1 hypothetical protein ASPWEDRAFT_25143 [Aspergillus wentii DTO 134E9]
MAWYSLLPPDLIYLESWAVRVFFVLGLLTIVPWAALLVFDIVLYICRMTTYEFPVIGGRAQGMQRPRAPSLNERPSGQRRVFGLRGVEMDSPGDDVYTEEKEGLSYMKFKDGDGEVKWRSPRERVANTT